MSHEAQGDQLSTSHTLKFPVELKAPDGSVRETISELQLHTLDAGKARKVLNAKDKGTGDFTHALVCAVCQIPPGTCDRIDSRDFMDLVEACSPFFARFQPT